MRSARKLEVQTELRSQALGKENGFLDVTSEAGVLRVKYNKR